ncbi:MAG: hypothetical protein JW839_05825, partial [Candidatus Lokiarchaeota archaeon]|nr:hypothetical protein [Candidatus Lokiarchaeota archaeon]
ASGWAGLAVAVAGIALVFTSTITATKRRYARTNARISSLLAARNRGAGARPPLGPYRHAEPIEVMLAEARRRQLPFFPNRQLGRLLREYRDATERPAIVERAALGELAARARDAILAGDLQHAGNLAAVMRASITRAAVSGIFSAGFKKEAGDAVDSLVQLACGRLERCRGQLDEFFARQADDCRALLRVLGAILPRQPADRLLDALSSAGRALPSRP